MKAEGKSKKELISELNALRRRLKKLEKSEAEFAKTRELLQKERETFFPILHKAPYGVALIEKTGKFLYINPEFTRITGYSSEDIFLERDWFHRAPIFAEYSRQVLETWKRDVLEKGLDRVLTVVCKEGEVKEIEFKPTLLDDGRIIVMLSDVTERKRAEEELKRYRTHLEELVAERTAELQATNQQLQREIAERRRVEQEINKLNEDLARRAMELQAANKELEAFSYSVSHDLRTPLLGIYGLSRLLLEKYAADLPSKGISFLSNIERDTQKMLQLIDNLMALSHFDHQQLNPTRIDMEDLARSVFEELLRISPYPPDKPLQLKVDPLPPAYGDPAMIRQVFFNLLANALKFSKPKGTCLIEIGCLPGENEHTYFVRDEGVGFDMEHADKLFGVFQRLHSSPEFEGSGIGLAIVQRIVHRQGGKVWADGSPGMGATFYFTLPKGL